MGARLQIPPEVTRALRALDERWLALLDALGWRLRRDPASWVSWDGAGTLNVAPDEALDDDDCLAQIVVHELCHLRVEGPDSVRAVDWGLCNLADDHLDREYAALRVQAALLERFGLREVLVPTTDHRWFYEALPGDPLGEVDTRADEGTRPDGSAGPDGAGPGDGAAGVDAAACARSALIARAALASPAPAWWAALEAELASTREALGRG